MLFYYFMPSYPSIYDIILDGQFHLCSFLSAVAAATELDFQMKSFSFAIATILLQRHNCVCACVHTHTHYNQKLLHCT